MSNDQGKSCESGNALDDIFNLVVLDLAAITGVTRAAAFVENRLQISCMMQLKRHRLLAYFTAIRNTHCCLRCQKAETQDFATNPVKQESMSSSFRVVAPDQKIRRA